MRTAPPSRAPALTPPKATTSTSPAVRGDNQLRTLAFDMAERSGRLAVMSDAVCGLWSVDYWNVKVITVEVRQNIDGLAEVFRQSVLKAADELADPTKRMRCGAVQPLALQALVNWEQLADMR
jgi:hypothetical protein